MKTPSVREVHRPLNRLIRDAREKFEEELQTYEKEVVDYDARKKAYAAQAQDKHRGKEVAKPVDYPQEPKKPKECRYMVNDTTIEKLADLLKENPVGLLLFRDELIGLLATWERLGHEQDRAFHLEAWNGNGSITIDRIKRGTTHVNVVCECIFGGIQPSKLLPYLQAATGHENDGFVQRLQVAVFPNPAPWEYGDDYPDKIAMDQAFKLIKKLADTDFKDISYDADEYNQFPYTYFSTQAQTIFRQWLIEWETKTLPAETGLLLEHFTKYRSLMPSLALIFHVINCLDAAQPVEGTNKQLVSADAAQMAVRWCDYLMTHARRIYGLLDTQQVESAKALLQHLKAGHLNDGFKARDVQRKSWSSLSSLDIVESALSELVAHYWLMEVPAPQPTGGRPAAPHYLINPEIIQKA